MSKTDQEHRISYKAGITRTPSDFLCQDGELAECINLTTDNEELKPIVQPTLEFTQIGTSNQDKVVYVHKYNSMERYIKFYKSDSVWMIGWWDGVSWKNIGTTGNYASVSSSDAKVTSIGKILIVSDDKKVQTFRWNDTGYDNLGELPTPDLKFWLNQTTINIREKYGESIDFGRPNDDSKIQDQKTYDDLVLGLYEEGRKKLNHNKNFVSPFFVRAAIELYDGSYTKITNPVLMWPCTLDNHYAIRSGADNEYLHMFLNGSRLFCSMTTDYTKYKDIVKNVVLFVTAPVELYDLVGNQQIDTLAQGEIKTDGIYRAANETLSTYHKNTVATGSADQYHVLTRNLQDFYNNLNSASIFYKLCEIGIKGVTGLDTANKIYSTTLETITTQKRLESDDYYSHCALKADVLLAYNSRLNLASVSRGFFEGFGHFMPYEDPIENTYYFYVKITTDTGDIWVKHKQVTHEKQGFYFFYPDARAKHVTIYKTSANVCVLDAELKEHPGLNGAYYLTTYVHEWQERYNYIPEYVPSGDIDADQADNAAMEMLPNYILTSEVNNPWIFKSEGYNKVGTGRILAISVVTMALSQDTFGKTPLVVFSESGVWGMHVDKTGMYEGVDPFTRDVIINPHNIIQTDGAVYFVSKRGLMVVYGLENRGTGVQCVSERMNGKTFNTANLTNISAGTDWNTIVTTCQGDDTFQKYICAAKTVMAYDYIDNRIIITNPDYGYSYILNIADGSIAKNILPARVSNVINNYPDYLMQSGGALYTLYKKPREEESNARRRAFILTRPMKLAGPVSKASLRQLMNVGMWGSDSVVETKLYFSDDLRTWYEDISRHGAAAKYYRIALYLYMLPTERLSGTIITSQERRTNNMR